MNVVEPEEDPEPEEPPVDINATHPDTGRPLYDENGQLIEYVELPIGTDDLVNIVAFGHLKVVQYGMMAVGAFSITQITSDDDPIWCRR